MPSQIEKLRELVGKKKVEADGPPEGEAAMLDTVDLPASSDDSGDWEELPGAISPFSASGSDVPTQTGIPALSEKRHDSSPAPTKIPEAANQTLHGSPSLIVQGQLAAAMQKTKIAALKAGSAKVPAAANRTVHGSPSMVAPPLLASDTHLLTESRKPVARRPAATARPAGSLSRGIREGRAEREREKAEEEDKNKAWRDINNAEAELNKTIEAFEKQKEQEQKDVDELKRMLEQFEQELLEKQQGIREMEAGVEVEREKVFELEKRLKKASAAEFARLKEKLEAEIAEIEKAEVDKLKAVIEAKRHIMDDLKRKIDALAAERAKLESAPDKLKALLDQLLKRQKAILNREKTVKNAEERVGIRRDVVEGREERIGTQESKLLEEIRKQFAEAAAAKTKAETIIEEGQEELKDRKHSLFLERGRLSEWITGENNELARNRRLVWISVAAVAALTLGSGAIFAGVSYWLKQKAEEIGALEAEVEALEGEIAKFKQLKNKDKAIVAVADKESPSTPPVEPESKIDLEPITGFKFSEFRGSVDGMEVEKTCPLVTPEAFEKLQGILADKGVGQALGRLGNLCNVMDFKEVRGLKGSYVGHTFPKNFSIDDKLIAGLAGIIDSLSEKEIKRITLIFHMENGADNFKRMKVKKEKDGDPLMQMNLNGVKDATTYGTVGLTGDLSIDFQTTVGVMAQRLDSSKAIERAARIALEGGISYKKCLAIVKGSESKDEVIGTIPESAYKELSRILEGPPDLLIEEVFEEEVETVEAKVE